MPRKTAALALVALCGVSLPGADAVPHGRMRFPMDARAALMQTETSKLSALPKAYQTGEFPDSVKADIASGTCTQIEEAFKYAHTDDVTFNTVGSACVAGYESFGEFESPHSSCGLEDATVEGKLTRCVYKEAGDFVREEYLLGPFESTGGNDWWDMDIVDLQLAVASNYTYIASWGVTMHDADTGEALSLPPLHTHHITLLDPTGRTKEATQAGYSMADVKRAGFSWEEAHRAGYPASKVILYEGLDDLAQARESKGFERNSAHI